MTDLSKKDDKSSDDTGINGKPEFDELESVGEDKKYPYPKSIGFIITNEFCERFSYYGIRTILVIYLKNKLFYTEDDSIVIYHVFNMFVYFFPLFGAMIADSWLGRFKTIFSLSIIYVIGSALIALTAIGPLGIPLSAFTMIGLLLVAMGTGGIKPCVSAFGGDQFKLPQQAAQLATFFSVFYFAINSGSLISTFITPILREDVKCFGENDCYSLAFGVPGILMFVSIVVFVIGKSLYVVKEPQGNVLAEVSKCIVHAVSRRRVVRKEQKREHWLDYADDKYSTNQISDIKAALKVLLLFIPLPIFWALYDQQGSRWTFQASRMNGEVGSFIIKPDQVQVVNPLLILICIPLFEWVIYPALAWCRLVTKPLHKMVLGGVLAGVAFVVSGILELELQKTYPVLPSPGISQLRIYNGHMCDFTINTPQTESNIYFNETLIKSLSTYQDLRVPAKGQVKYPYELKGVNCAAYPDTFNGTIEVESNKAISYLINDNEETVSLFRFEDESDKTENGDPAVRVLRSFEGGLGKDDTIFRNVGSEVDTLAINSTDIDRHDISPSVYSIYVGKELVKKEFKIELGAVYTIIINKQAGKTPVSNSTLIAKPNTIHMLLLLPQYIILTMGEVMFSVTGLEFSFTQAPSSMKSVLTAGWLLTVAFGNLIVVIVAEAKGLESQADEFFLFAGLMFADMIIFFLMTLRYKYVNTNENESEIDELPIPNSKIEKIGIDNLNFKNDE